MESIAPRQLGACCLQNGHSPSSQLDYYDEVMCETTTRASLQAEHLTMHQSPIQLIRRRSEHATAAAAPRAGAQQRRAWQRGGAGRDALVRERAPGERDAADPAGVAPGDAAARPVRLPHHHARAEGRAARRARRQSAHSEVRSAPGEGEEATRCRVLHAAAGTQHSDKAEAHAPELSRAFLLAQLQLSETKAHLRKRFPRHYRDLI